MGTWAVEFDGPTHFLTSRAPTGATLLKRRHLELLGHALVTVPYWEWEGCKRAGERVQYLRGKLEQFRKCGPVTAPSTGNLKQEKKEEEAAGEVGAADMWEKRESKTRKRPYYFNRRTGESRWEAPLSPLAKRGRRSPSADM